MVVVPTYSTTVRSSSDDIVLDLQVWIKHRSVELGFAVEAVANALPVCGWLGHCRVSGVHAHVKCVWVEVSLAAELMVRRLELGDSATWPVLGTKATYTFPCSVV